MSDNKQPRIPMASVTRGFILGIPVFVVLLVAAIIVYLIAGAVGWSGRTQIVIAMCAGPFLGLVILGMIWIVFKPKIL